MLQAPPAAQVLRAGLYNRESRMASKADRDHARSVEQQNEANADAREVNGWAVTQTYRDPGLSASASRAPRAAPTGWTTGVRWLM